MIADAEGGAAVCSLRGSVPSLNVFLTEMLNLILCSEWVCVSGLGWAADLPTDNMEAAVAQSHREALHEPDN